MGNNNTRDVEKYFSPSRENSVLKLFCGFSQRAGFASVLARAALFGLFRSFNIDYQPLLTNYLPERI
jgi:hypothetical protein